jgi:hypothetical protein
MGSMWQRTMTAAALLSLALTGGGTASPARAEGLRGGARDAWGRLHGGALARGVQRPHRSGGPAGGWLHHWNAVAIDASGLDHTPVAPGESRVFGEQYGPVRAARAMAIVHVAIFEAVNAIAGGYRSYVGLPRAHAGASLRAAVSQTAHDALVALFPSQAAALDDELADSLRRIPRGFPKTKGIEVGRAAAAAILARRAHDGADHAEPVVGVDFLPSDEPGKWRQDPISLIPLALGAHWAKVAPFAMTSADQFRAPPPPALTDPAYTAAYFEVQSLGGDGVATPTARTDDQTIAGLYWAYDGTPSLCAPPRLYNQIAVQIADQMGSGLVAQARLLALANVAMADAALAVWESKYHYQLWRPITGIRESDPGTGPTGLGDGNPATQGDPAFTPLGAPASNLGGSFTPPFPAYPSGHAGIGAALFQTLRRFYGTDAIAFTFVSDEFNGVTRGSDGAVRPLLPRSFPSLSAAEEENGQSRIYLGIHWTFDKTEGIAQGRRVADHVFDRVFLPRKTRR